MKRVIRLASAVRASLSLAWGIAKALRRGAASEPPPWEDAREETPSTPAGNTGDSTPSADNDGTSEAFDEAAPTSPPAEASVPSQEAPAEPSSTEGPEASVPDEAESDEAGNGTAVKGVFLKYPQRIIDFLNESSAEDLEKAGLRPQVVRKILHARPFASVDDLANANGIGRRSLRVLRDHLEGD